MSVKVMQQVFEHSKATGNDRVVLLVLADHAHDDGTSAYPSHKRIAKKSGGISERTVRYCLARLLGAGEIERVGRRGKTIEYRISNPANLAGVESATRQGAAGIPRQRVADKPLEEPSTSEQREEVPPSLLPLTATLNRVVEGKGARPLKIAAAIRACEKFHDRDLVREAEDFEHYWLDGMGENRELRDVAGAWRNWLRRAPKASTRRNGRRRGVSFAQLERLDSELASREAA